MTTSAAAPIEYSFRDGGVTSAPLRALNWAGRLASGLGVSLPSLDPDALVAAACKQAGASDLGSDSFREPLARYCESLESEAGLSTFGRVLNRGTVVGSLANRIRLHAWAREHPEVREEEIQGPWVIVGLPRTGTTLLSFLLGLDPFARALLTWEAASPVPPPTLAEASTDPRIAEAAKQFTQLENLSPALQAMHPTGPMLPQECVPLHMLDLRSLGLETTAFVPSYGRWLDGCDMAPAYEQHRLALQVLQSAQPTERWVLKTPNHLWCLPTLLDFYPDARVVWSHRDPGKVVTSVASLVNTIQRMGAARRDPRPVAEEWLAKLESGLDKGMAFDEKADAGWCHHLQYSALMRDPKAAMRALYAHFGETLSPLHERRIEAWMRDRPQTAHGRHVYDPADYGWSYDGLAERFAGYRERYGIERE